MSLFWPIYLSLTISQVFFVPPKTWNEPEVLNVSLSHKNRSSNSTEVYQKPPNCRWRSMETYYPTSIGFVSPHVIIIVPVERCIFVNLCIKAVLAGCTLGSSGCWIWQGMHQNSCGTECTSRESLIETGNIYSRSMVSNIEGPVTLFFSLFHAYVSSCL